ncbi:Uma2 family endonuclease [Kitasatospora aureofaciens]|uniref:Uma2 family endonuclease n=1 Tax=Kitasatospora aureofaciens TaxID=1894 RepID=UPI001C47ECCD|nr:Uma2 family endonuclease [Kitasatospora aureofaciens]MBV6702636.1 Uma2 family endonuclease [Kitasatospora aureofaciens]
MTAISDRPQMLPEEFEEFARHLTRTALGIRLEFINGKLGIKPVPDGDHSMIIEWLTRICIQARPELWLYNHGLKIQTYRGGRAHPDGTLAPSGTVAGQGEWASTNGVLMVVEVTSCDSDTERRDRVEKPRAYAETGIPVYLLIDRDSAEVTVYSEPDGVRYETVQILPFGKTVRLPEPVGISLDTEPLKNWVR